MTQAAEARELTEPSETYSVPAPASSRELTLHWPRSVPRPSRLEVALVVGLSALLHVSVGAAALGARDSTRPKPLSRVQVALERAPRRPAPPPREAAPPPPPSRARPLTKSEAPRPTPAPVAAAPEAPAVAAPPPDTGSSAAPAEGGELFAGAGGLGTAAPSPPAPPAPLPKKPEPAPVVQPHEGANYLKNPRPPYPSLARRQGWEGTTLLRVQVSPSGKPGAVQVQRTSGRTALDDAALEAVKRWTFVPASQGGAPVSGWVTVPIVFRLQ